MDGVRYTKVATLGTTLTLAITFASFTYDRCKTGIGKGDSLAVYFAIYAAISVTIYSVLTFCESFGRHSTLAVLDVPMTTFGFLWVFIGATIANLAQNDGVPLLLKIVSSLLTGFSLLTMHLTHYDRNIRKLAPSVTGQAGNFGKAEGEYDEETNVDI